MMVMTEGGEQTSLPPASQDRVRKYRLWSNLSTYGFIPLLAIGFVAVLLGIRVGDPSYIGGNTWAFNDIGGVLFIFGVSVIVLGIGGLFLSLIQLGRYASDPSDALDSIKAVMKYAPRADIPWTECETEAFEIAKGLILKGHSGQDLMFMGNQLQFLGLVTLNHAREEEMLKWIVEGNEAALDVANDALKRAGYKLVRDEEQEEKP